MQKEFGHCSLPFNYIRLILIVAETGWNTVHYMDQYFTIGISLFIEECAAVIFVVVTRPAAVARK